MTSGVPADRLSDEDLRHDLLQLKNKQADIEQDGTADQKLNHHSRTAELEAEFVRRFGPAATTDDSRAAADEPDTSAGDAGDARPAGSVEDATLEQ